MKKRRIYIKKKLTERVLTVKLCKIHHLKKRIILKYLYSGKEAKILEKNHLIKVNNKK